MCMSLLPAGTCVSRVRASPGSGVADGYELPCQCLILITPPPSAVKTINSGAHMMPMSLKLAVIFLETSSYFVCGQSLVLTQLPLLGTLLFVPHADSIGLVPLHPASLFLRSSLSSSISPPLNGGVCKSIIISSVALCHAHIPGICASHPQNELLFCFYFSVIL